MIHSFKVGPTDINTRPSCFSVQDKLHIYLYLCLFLYLSLPLSICLSLLSPVAFDDTVIAGFGQRASARFSDNRDREA